MNARVGIAIAALLGAGCGGKIAPGTEIERSTPAPPDATQAPDGGATPAAATSQTAPACDGLGDVQDLAPPADPWGEPSVTYYQGFAVDQGVVYFDLSRDFADDSAVGLYMQSLDDPSTPPVAIVPEERGDAVQLQYPWIGVSGRELYYTHGSPEHLFVRHLDTNETESLDANGFEHWGLYVLVPGGLVWSTWPSGDPTTWELVFYDAATRTTSTLASGPQDGGFTFPTRLRYATDTIYYARGDQFEAVPLAGGPPRVVRKVDPASVLWLGQAWLLGADERGIYVCDYWAKTKFGPVACTLTVTAPDGMPAGTLVDPVAFQSYVYEADAFATDDRYAYWTQLQDLATGDDPQPAYVLARAPKTGGAPCVVDARKPVQLAVDATRITYVTSDGIATRGTR